MIYDFDAVTLKSITSVNDFTNDINFDFDFGPTPNQHGGYLEESEGWSQEIVLTSNSDSAFQWTAGVYYSDLEDFSSFYIYDKTVREDTASVRPTVTVDIDGVPTDFTVLTATGIVSDETLLNNFFANAVQIDTEYYGIFGQARIFGERHAPSDWQACAITTKTRKRHAAESNFTGDANMDGVVDRVVNILPGVEGSSPFILPDSAIDVFSINCSASDAITSSNTTQASSSFGEFDNVTWRAGVEFDFNDEIMLYLTGSTGYLSGSASTQTTTDEQESQVIEVGFRSVYAGQHSTAQWRRSLTPSTRIS